MNPTTNVNELDARRTDWKPGTTIKLDDGQEWHFRRPRVGFKVVFHPDKQRIEDAKLSPWTDLGPDVTQALEIIKTESLLGSLMLAASLLRVNYDLTWEQAAELVPWRSEDERNASMWEQILDVVAASTKPAKEATEAA